jgi:hypothetical protein
MSKTDPTLPLDIKKNLGLQPWTMILGIAFAGFYNLFPLLIGGLSLDAFLNGAGLWTFLGLTAMTVTLFVVLRNPSQLTIDQTGVTLKSKRTDIFVTWSDVAHVTSVNNAVRIELKGRPEEDGVLIPEGFGLPPARLTPVLRDAVERWGGTPAGESTSTAPPGLAKTSLRDSMRRTFMVLGAIYGLLIVGVVVWQVADYGKTSRLKAHGVRANAAVVRIYTDQCGRHGCNLNVEYAYSTNSGQTFHGYGYLTSDDNLDDEDYKFAKTHSTVPIVFDVSAPKLSALNFRDRVFTQDSISWRLQFIALIAGLFAAAGAVVAVPLLLAYRKALKNAP